MDALLGFAAGVMVAASFFSLISPALEMAEELKMTSWIVISLGFLSGGVLLFIGDKVYDYLSKLRKDENSSKAKRCFMLISSITLHNIPEGMAVGVAFGSLAYSLTGSTLASALTLALGIGLQNFPEGLAVALPMHQTLKNKHKAFIFGSLSGIAEPIFAIVGFFLANQITFLMPWLLAFSAGAMIYVVIEELLPELHINEKTTIGTWAFLFGFILMMILDICL